MKNNFWFSDHKNLLPALHEEDTETVPQQLSKSVNKIGASNDVILDPNKSKASNLFLAEGLVATIVAVAFIIFMFHYYKRKGTNDLK